MPVENRPAPSGEQRTADLQPGRAPETEPAPPRWSWKADGLRAALAFAATFAAFANSLPNGFVRDDVPILRDNPRLEDPWNLGAVLGTPYWGEENPNARLYRPLALWTHALDRAVFGPGPLGAHLGNVVGASLLSALVYAFLFRLTGRRGLALSAALLYGLHPVHSEVVANGVGRSDIGAALAAVGALLLHLSSVEATRGGGAARLRFGAALLLYGTSLGFKESALTLPLLAFGMEAWVLDPVRGSRSPGRLRRLALYALPLAAYLAARGAVVGSGPPTVPETLAGATALQRVLHALETLLLYLGQLLLPLDLRAEYEDFTRPVRPSLGDARVLASLLPWPALAVILRRLSRRGERVPVYGALWFLVAILPTSNLFLTIGVVRAERLLFLPSLGFALVLAWLLQSLRRVHPILPLAALVPLLGLYGGRTVRRNADWRDEATFLAVTLRQNPGNPRLWLAVGNARLTSGDTSGAEGAFRRSIALHESMGFFPADVHTSYAHALLLRGDREGAQVRYRRVLDIDPRRFGALVILGGLLIQDSATRAEGIGLLQRAATVKAPHPLPHLKLATAHRLAGDLPAALRSIETAIRLEPNLPESWIEKAQIHEAMGDAGAATEARRRAASARRPGSPLLPP